MNDDQIDDSIIASAYKTYRAIELLLGNATQFSEKTELEFYGDLLIDFQQDLIVNLSQYNAASLADIKKKFEVLYNESGFCSKDANKTPTEALAESILSDLAAFIDRDRDAGDQLNLVRKSD